MKIRIKGNSIRLRLSQSEVQDFDRDGFVEDRIHFGPSILRYEMRRSSTTAVSASFANQLIQISIPEAIASNWCESDQVGFSAKQGIDTGAPLSILIEKDFQCMTERPGEDEADLFPNPGNHSKDC